MHDEFDIIDYFKDKIDTYNTMYDNYKNLLDNGYSDKVYSKQLINERKALVNAILHSKLDNEVINALLLMVS